MNSSKESVFFYIFFWKVKIIYASFTILKFCCDFSHSLCFFFLCKITFSFVSFLFWICFLDMANKQTKKAIRFTILGYVYFARLYYNVCSFRSVILTVSSPLTYCEICYTTAFSLLRLTFYYNRIMDIKHNVQFKLSWCIILWLYHFGWSWKITAVEFTLI